MEKRRIGELSDLRDFLVSLIDMKGKQFSYAIERNISKIESALTKSKKKMYAKECFKDNKDFDSYMKDFKSISEQYGDKSKEGELLIDETGHAVISEVNKETYEKAKKDIEKKNPEGVKNLKERESAYKDFRMEEVELEWYMIMREEHFPDDVSARQRILLRFMTDKSLVSIEEEIKGEEKKDS